MKKQTLISTTLSIIILLGAGLSAFAQTTAGSYWSPAARQLRQEIMNRAILRQATRGNHSRSRASYRSARSRRYRR